MLKKRVPLLIKETGSGAKSKTTMPPISKSKAKATDSKKNDTAMLSLKTNPEAAIDSENNLQTQLDEFGKQNIKTFAKEFSKQYSKSPKQFYMINGASSGAQISVEDFKNLRKIIQTSVGDKSSPVNNETMYYFLRTLLFLSANFFKKN